MQRKMKKDELLIYKKLLESDVERFQKKMKNNEIKQLRYFCVDETSLDKESCDILKNYSSLSTLYYKSEEFRDESLLIFENFIIKNKLSSLDVSIDFLTELKDFLSVIERNTFLEYLRIDSKYDFDAVSLQSINNILTNNPNLKILDLEQKSILKNNGVWDFSSYKVEFNDNYSVKELKIGQGVVMKDFSFLSKFKELESLKLEVKCNDLWDAIKIISKDNHKNLRSIHFYYSKNISSEINFSNTLLTSIHAELAGNLQLESFLKGLMSHKILKNLSIDFISKDIILDSVWIEYLKEILIQTTSLKDLKLYDLKFSEEELKLFLKGLEKAESLQSLLFKTDLYHNFEEEFGKFLKSKDHLEDLCIGNDEQIIFSDSCYGNFKVGDFMLHFQYHKNLKSLKIVNCHWNDGSTILFSNFMKNNQNLEILNLNSIEKEEDLKMICKSIENHKNIKDLAIQPFNSLPGKCFLEMIQNNTSLEKVYFSYTSFDRQDVENFMKFMVKNEKLKNVDIRIQGVFESYFYFFQEYLFYNYSILYFKLGIIDLITPKRNEGFIQNYYKIPKSYLDIRFKFQ